MISKFFIERPVLSNVIAILMILIGGVCLVPPRGRAISRRGAADGAGHDALSRRQRQDRDRYRGAADRAAGQRRRGHALHAVLQRRRRHLFADGDVQDRHRPQLRAGAGAEPRVERAVATAAVGAEPGRHRPEEIDGDPAVRDADLAERDLRQPVPDQLRHHQHPRRAVAAAGRRQRHRVRRRPVFDAGLARSEQAAGARADAAGRHSGDPAAEPAGHRGPGRHAADAAGTGVPVHAERQRPARRRETSSRTSSSRPAPTATSPGCATSAGSNSARRPTARCSRSTRSRRPASAYSSRPAPTRSRSRRRSRRRWRRWPRRFRRTSSTTRRSTPPSSSRNRSRKSTRR